ncbi:hypothetical protein MNEG_5410 [Monoraphidium neglectum]|uniref:RRM domain-containing protein n=1 Tax=Monoraphidium neglectum TaxID=145388 RepID=A0A0D2MHJ9_9CHLO|nr:hypothetical protein MNEG_5410 [Monoraphidium neglectum]KIZ02545.1 hypothetical protein MNEG_5410 [Monoraphidium neglectum]|eukprot:XP_013901564.1 hypothetical protein MNEG_5410 [Monoraphidium neglectum]
MATETARARFEAGWIGLAQGRNRQVKEVAFVYEPDGRPSGLAFAEFATRDEALQAMSKNGAFIGERYVRLLHVPKQEMLEQVRLGTIAIPGNAHRRSRFQQQQQQQQAAPGLHFMHGGPALSSPFDHFAQRGAVQLPHLQQHPHAAYGAQIDALSQMARGGVQAVQHVVPQQLQQQHQQPHQQQPQLQQQQRLVEFQPYPQQPNGGGGIHLGHAGSGVPVSNAGGGGNAVMGVAGIPISMPLGVTMAPQYVQIGPNGVAALQLAQPMAGGGGGVQVAQVVSQDGLQIAMAGAPIGLHQVQMAPPHMALAYQLGGMTLGGTPRGVQQQHMQQQQIGHQQQISHHQQQQHSQHQHNHQHHQQQQQHLGLPQGAVLAPAGAHIMACAAPAPAGPHQNGYAAAGRLMVGQSGSPGGQAPVMVIGTESKTVKIRGLPFRATPLDIFNFFEGMPKPPSPLPCGPSHAAGHIVHPRQRQ